jgi:hypothetical protein
MYELDLHSTGRHEGRRVFLRLRMKSLRDVRETIAAALWLYRKSLNSLRGLNRW